jgi:hypothetical protein
LTAKDDVNEQEWLKRKPKAHQTKNQAKNEYFRHCQAAKQIAPKSQQIYALYYSK